MPKGIFGKVEALKGIAELEKKKFWGGKWIEFEQSKGKGGAQKIKPAKNRLENEERGCFRERSSGKARRRPDQK